MSCFNLKSVVNVVVSCKHWLLQLQFCLNFYLLPQIFVLYFLVYWYHYTFLSCIYSVDLIYVNFYFNLNISQIISFLCCFSLTLYLPPPKKLSTLTLCSIVVMSLDTLCFLPVIVLTVFHMSLVCKGRTTNEQVGPQQRRLKKRRETVRLSCTKQMGSARSSMRTTHPFHCPPETLIYFDLTVNLVGGANVACFVSLLVHIAIHTSL